jgi:hypothetical protein
VSNSDGIHLDDCACCKGVPAPPELSNPPGQDRLRYRIDTQPTFFRRMVAKLPTQPVPPSDTPDPNAPRPLRALTARAPDDPTIAILDAWATSADVLTFYQERIINEGFLRTATERRSVLELAREIGYELSPGVAASTDLVYLLETGLGAPKRTPIPLGAKVLSVPGPNETPQTFETIEAFEARQEWNELLPRRSDPELILPGMTDMFLAGTDSQLQAGDVILVVGLNRFDAPTNGNWDVITLTAVTPETTTGLRTRIAWREPLRTTAPAQVFAFRKRVKLFGHNAPLFKSLPNETKRAFGDTNLAAEDWSDLSIDRFNLTQDSAELDANPNFLDLDITGSKIARGSWLALADIDVGSEGRQSTTPSLTDPPPASQFPPVDVRPPPFPFGVAAEPIDFVASPPPEFNPDEDADAALSRVTRTPQLVTRAEFALSSTVTRVVPDDFGGLFGANRRRVALHAESELLAVGTRPVIAPVDGREVLPEIADVAVLTDDATGRFVALDGTAEGLAPPQKIALVGKRTRVQFVDRATMDARLLASIPDNVTEALRVPLQQDLSGQVNLFFAPDDGSDRTESLEDNDFELLEAPAPLAPLVARRFEFEAFTDAIIRFIFWWLLTLFPQFFFNYFPSVEVRRPNRRWHVRARTGLVGTVDGPSEAVDFLPAEKDAELVGEVGRIAAVHQAGSRTVLELEARLKKIYDRSSLTLSANVVAATHGETTANEVLGNGDAAQLNQSFVLQKTPLTYVSSGSSASGIASTLQVRVNDVLWAEVPALFGHGPEEQIYTIRLSDDGKTRVIFGDGRNGARLPTGTGNVRATYRQGIGLEGEVAAGRLTLATTRPLGVRAVTNPADATGAAAPAKLEDARQNAPLTVRTLDRAVSLEDLEDFARAFAGIGKAQAVSAWSGNTHLAHITVGSASGEPIPADAPVRINLGKALRAQGDPSLLFQIDTYVPKSFRITAQVRVDPRFESAKVLDAVRAALADAFSFARRSFGQAVTEAEVLAVIQSVQGVEAANLLVLSATPAASDEKILPAARVRFDDATRSLAPAELLTINPVAIVLTELVIQS